jgi:flagellin
MHIRGFIMIAHFNHDLTGLAFETHRAQLDLDASVAKLSSGKRMQNAKHDAGGFQQAAKLGSRHKRDVASMQNLQNLISYSQIQDGSLETVGKIINRMNTLATRALDVTSSDNDRENYNKEFIELAAQLEEIKLEKFNDLDVFGAGGFSDAKKDFIEVLQKQWLKGAMNVIEDRYGLSPEGTDSLEVIVNENDTGSFTAFVSYAGQDVIEMQFDLPDFQEPFTAPSSDSPIYRGDRVTAHEMTHAVMADVLQLNTSVNGTGGGGGASWFIEGTAEFIHGADYRVVSDLGGVINLDATQSGGSDVRFNDLASQQAKVDANGASLINAIGTGKEGWSNSLQYSSAYVATRYLHNELKNTGVGAPNGIKDMLMWMKDNNESVGGALNNFLSTKYANASTAHDEFITDFKTNGLTFLRDTMNLYNNDTGAITGLDADGGAEITATDAVPNTGAGFAPDATAQTQPLATTKGGNPGFTLTWEEEKASLAATIDGSGATWNLQSVNTITVSDTTKFNLESISNARGTLTELTTWMTNLATQRSLVGANMSRLEKEMDNLSRKMGGREMAVSRIEDTDVARESTKFASNQVKMQASVAILAQAKQTNVLLADLVRGVNVGG